MIIDFKKLFRKHKPINEWQRVVNDNLIVIRMKVDHGFQVHVWDMIDNKLIVNHNIFVDTVEQALEQALLLI